MSGEAGLAMTKRLANVPACCFAVDIHCLNGQTPVACALSVALYDGSVDFIEHHETTYLHPNERRYLLAKLAERRKIEYLLGRLAAKQAAANLLGETNFAEIDITSGVFNQPFIRHRSLDIPEISISHKIPVAIALAAQAGHCMGVDIEERDRRRINVMESALTAGEIEMVKRNSRCYESACTQLWATKEALSKVLKTGLTTPWEIYETSEWTFANGTLENCCFRYFYQYRAHTWLLGSYALAIVLPRHASLTLDTELLCVHFANR